MSARPTSLALGASSWEGTLISALVPKTAEIGPFRRCVDVVDLLADAGAGTVAAIIVDASFPRLDATVISRLSRAEVVLLGICDDDAGQRRLQQWGLDDVVVIDPQDPASAVAAIVSLLSQAAPRSAAPAHPETAGHPGGKLVAVWGPAGAPGRTSVAVGLAEVAASSGVGAMAVDADVAAPGIAGALGMQADVSGLIAACRHAEHGTLDPASLARAARAVTGNFRVLTGIPHPNRRGELRSAALRAVWACSRTLSAYTVVDVGSSCECDGEQFDDAAFTSRDTAATTAIADADLVVAVLGCEPGSLSRFLSAIGPVRDLCHAPIHVVINRARNSVAGAQELQQIRSLVRQQAGAAAVWVIPDDRDAFDAASARGLTVLEHAPQSRASKSIRDLSAGVYQACIAAKPAA